MNRLEAISVCRSNAYLTCYLKVLPSVLFVRKPCESTSYGFIKAKTYKILSRSFTCLRILFRCPHITMQYHLIEWHLQEPRKKITSHEMPFKVRKKLRRLWNRDSMSFIACLSFGVNALIRAKRIK